MNFPTPLLAATKLSLWLTPIWMLAMGILAGLVVLAAVWGLLRLVKPSAGQWASRRVHEGVLAPISYVLLAVVAVGLLSTPTVETKQIFDSLQRLSSVGETTETLELEPGALDEPVAIAFRNDELVSYEFSAEQDLRIATEEGLAFKSPAVVVEGGDAYAWSPGSKRGRGFRDDVTTLYLTNEGDAPNPVELTVVTDVRVPQVRHLPVIAGSVIGLFVIYLGLQWIFPQLAIISTATAKEALGQPLFIVLMLLGAAALVAYVFIPYKTLGEDVKMLMQTGLGTILMIAIIFTLWTSSVSVAEEIEGKTALTLLSKPISRRQFVLGKFFGIVWAALVIFVLLGAIFMATLSYKVVYEARETSKSVNQWQECYEPMIQAAPGLALGFLETCIFAATGVAISTRLPMLPNLLICGSIYALGHLTPLIVQSSEEGLEFVHFFANLLSIILPNLDLLNIQNAISGGIYIPPEYLGWSALLTALYCTVMLLIALVLFEDRDLA